MQDLYSLIDVDGDNTFSMHELVSAMSMFELDVNEEELFSVSDQL